ncbi:MAG: hypothetical protein ACREMU_00410, partial [Gemmatimonadaceae bacterium]
VSPFVILPTFAVALILARAARIDRGPRVLGAAAEGSDFADLPEPLRATVIDALDRLPEDDARKLLMGVIAQSRPILSTRSVALDADREAETRDNVVALVDACCATAIELAQVDAAATASGVTANAELAAKTVAARTLLAKRLGDATASLTSLYLAGLGADSSAATRVANLVQEIRVDADGREAASTELSALLGDQPSS